jgi:hypothetical protein
MIGLLGRENNRSQKSKYLELPGPETVPEGSPASGQLRIIGIAIGYGWITEESGQEFSLLHIVQTGSGDNPPSYPVGTEGSFHGGKATRAQS